MAALALLAALRKPASLAVLADPQWEELSLLHGTRAATRGVNARPVVASGSSEPKHETRVERDDRAHTLAEEVAA